MKSVGTSYTADQLRDYSKLFTRSSAISWIKNDFSSIKYKIDRYDTKWNTYTSATYLQYLKYVYFILAGNYPNEYILKNSFLNEWLIKELAENQSKIFSEFRVGKAVADLAIFNGNSKAFEIKTDFDSESRLISQLEYYKKVFNQIYLIIPKSKERIYKKYQSSVGIITFDFDRDEIFCLVNEPTNNGGIDPNFIMQVLHSHEYKKIIKLHYGYLPKMTSFVQFSLCSKLISSIPQETLNQYFISQMKSRIINDTLSSRSLMEFNQLSLALRLSKNDKAILINNLKTKIK